MSLALDAPMSAVGMHMHGLWRHLYYNHSLSTGMEGGGRGSLTQATRQGPGCIAYIDL